ncbi:MAG: hypothetical protein OXH31_00435 [Gammaproteobacteria bacterium]|nr:hypothetical protein [Gammaproteobacteria bacterium]
MNSKISRIEEDLKGFEKLDRHEDGIHVRNPPASDEERLRRLEKEVDEIRLNVRNFTRLCESIFAGMLEVIKDISADPKSRE